MRLVPPRLPKPVYSLGYQVLFSRRRVANTAVLDLFAGQRGLEVGGPSLFFHHSLPIYKVAAAIDGANFGETTMWEGEISEGRSFEYGSRKVGRQFIAEATNLGEIVDNTYDFVLSCHSLEHVANPLKAVDEWKRVVRPGGHVLLVLPNKDANFDHRRPTTTFEHLTDDLASDMGEDDLTHLEEILALHDLSRDRAAGTPEQFAARSRKNVENRGLHHHIFDMALLREVLNHAGLEEVFCHESYYDHLVVGRVPAA